VTVIAILLRHRRAREIAKTKRPCSVLNVGRCGRADPFLGIEARFGFAVAFGVLFCSGENRTVNESDSRLTSF
jgi:hypothetical protein